MAPFHGWNSNVSKLQSHYEETIYFSSLSPHNFLVLISSTSEGQKAELTLEPPTAFEPRFPGLGIHCLNHQAIVPCHSMLILWKINQTEIQLTTSRKVWCFNSANYPQASLMLSTVPLTFYIISFNYLEKNPPGRCIFLFHTISNKHLRIKIQLKRRNLPEKLAEA